ncbi:MAG TPA: hypothetical protein VIK59_04250 [Verrucomicrobiae bacterium]
MKPKTFTLIAGALAAEQRTVVAHSASYGFSRPQIFQAPAGATENHHSTTHFFRPIRGLNYFADIIPTVSPWATIARHSVTETKTVLHMILWRTPSPIC